MQKFLQGFFWFAFAAFLGASIPHVAYFFRAFEPGQDDVLQWSVSYAIAVSIDVTIFLLSVTVASLHRRGRAGGLIFSVWLFILALTALSWYINYTYAEHFQSTAMVAVTSIDIPLIGRIADINPFIASMFQALAIAYTWIADKVAADEKPKTAAELKTEADEMAARAKELDRIGGLKRQGRKGSLFGFIDDAKDVVTHAKDALADEKMRKAGEYLIRYPHATDEELAQYMNIKRPAAARFWRLKVQAMGTQPEQTEEESAEVQDTLEMSDSGIDTGTLAALSADMIRVVSRYPNLAALLSTSRRTATIKEVVEATGYTEKWIRNRIEKRHIKVSSRNKNLVLIDSVIVWLDKLAMTEQNSGNLKAIKLATVAPTNSTNGHHTQDL